MIGGTIFIFSFISMIITIKRRKNLITSLARVFYDNLTTQIIKKVDNTKKKPERRNQKTYWLNASQDSV